MVVVDGNDVVARGVNDDMETGGRPGCVSIFCMMVVPKGNHHPMGEAQQWAMSKQEGREPQREAKRRMEGASWWLLVVFPRSGPAAVPV
jgi:hypothetical protein